MKPSSVMRASFTPNKDELLIKIVELGAIAERDIYIEYRSAFPRQEQSVGSLQGAILYEADGDRRMYTYHDVYDIWDDPEQFANAGSPLLLKAPTASIDGSVAWLRALAHRSGFAVTKQQGSNKSKKL